MTALHERIKTLIARACGETLPREIPDDARIDTVPGWDSLSHIALVLLLEEAFGRTVPPDDVAHLRSLPDIAQWAQQAGAEASSIAPPPTVDEVAEALREAGLVPGDLVIVHSFVAALGKLERPDRLLIEALLRVLGRQGTLVMPTFTYSFCDTGFYDMEQTPSEVGVAGDSLRREFGGRRSAHPIFSVVVVGPLADEILALRAQTSFGPDSIFGYLLRQSAKLCAVGIGYEKVTFNHYPEEELAVPYRHWKTFRGVRVREGREEPVSVRYYVRSLEPEAVQDFSKVARLLEGEPFARQATAGGAVISCAPAPEYYRKLKAALADDPLFLLTDESRGHWEGDGPRAQPGADAATRAESRLRAVLTEDPSDLTAAQELASVLAAQGKARDAHDMVIASAIAAGGYAEIAGAVRLARRLRPPDSQEPDLKHISLAWAGSSTLEPLADACDLYCREAGILPRIEVGEFGQFRRYLTQSPAGADVLFVRVSPEALAPEVTGWRLGLGSADGARRAARELCELVRSHLEKCQVHVVLHTALPFHHSALGILDAEAEDGARAVAAAFNSQLADLASTHPRVHLLDEAAALLAHGAAAHDPGLYFSAGIEASGEAIVSLGAAQSHFAIAARRTPLKCIVVDLDDTLWGGIVGEAGVEGLSLAGEYPGEAHLQLQRWLLAHFRRGILLAICSRNERADAVAPFEQRSDMLLGLDQFAAISIDWRPKPERLVEIAKELNLGLDSLAFVDDSAFEREAVRQALPQVTVPDLPEQVAHWVPYLAGLHLFDVLSLTEEDRRRAATYAEQRQRQEAAQAHATYADFVASLQGVATLYYDEPALVPRAAQLCARTNQFNLSVRRHSEGEIEAMVRDPGTRVIALRAADRFGDAGIVGLAMVRSKGSQAELDTFLMSCRALGRGMEQALLGEASRVAREDLRAQVLLAEYVDNTRNHQVVALLDANGWEQVSSQGSTRVYREREPARWPGFVERCEA